MPVVDVDLYHPSIQIGLFAYSTFNEYGNDSFFFTKPLSPIPWSQFSDTFHASQIEFLLA